MGEFTDKLDAAGNKIAGKAKELYGDATGNEQLAAESASFIYNQLPLLPNKPFFREIKSVKMVAISNVFLFVAAASAGLIPRDYATVNSDLKTINNDTITLTNAANAYNGGVANSIPVQNAYSQTDKDVKSATTDTQNTASVTDAQAKAIINYINGTLAGNINSAIQAIIAKKSQFTADGLKSTVLSDLKTLKNDTDTFGAALIAKAGSSTNQANGKSVLNRIDGYFTTGINAFS